MTRVSEWQIPPQPLITYLITEPQQLISYIVSQVIHTSVDLAEAQPYLLCTVITPRA